MNTNYFCRTCTKTITETTFNSIFEDEIHRMLTKCTELIIEENDLPSEICLECINKLKEAYSFRKQVEDSDQFFRNQKTVKTEPNEIESETSENPVTEIKKENVLNVILIPGLQSVPKIVPSPPTKTPEVETVTENHTYTCPDCNLSVSFPNELLIRSHRQQHHPDARRLYFCKQCPEYFITAHSLKRHVYTHSDSCPSICPVCKKFFKNPIDLRAHEKRQHSETFLCEVCNLSFLTIKGLESHAEYHKKNPAFVCETCGKSYTLKSKLTEHKRIHNPETTFTCKFCSKPFPREGALIAHERIHTNERPLICNICGKGAFAISDLNVHMRTHSEEKPFKCEFPSCEKVYKTPGGLKHHHLSHTGERKYVCEICAKTFRDSNSLKAHMRAHKGEKPYKCKLCDFRTAYSGALYTHKKSHKLLK